MKKIIAVTALAIASTLMVNAETEANVGTQVQVQGMPTQAQGPAKMNVRAKTIQMVKANTQGMGEAMGQAMGEGGMPLPTTGDAATDAQLKALVTEMETKIKAIRDEYQTKIKAIIETRIKAAGTSTKPMMPKKGEQGNRGEGRPESADGTQVDGSMNANTNANGAVPPMPRMRLDGQVKGDFTANQDAPTGGVIKFLRGLFGGK
jgi:hypothetical protein